MQSLPDAELLKALQAARGKGRGDYPVAVLWGTVVLQIALRHPTTESCLAELARNADLRRRIGIEHEDRVPNPWNVSRFLHNLGEPNHYGHVRAVYDVLAQRLGRAIPDLGKNLAGDSTQLDARPAKDTAGEEGLPQPNRGRKEYHDDEGKVTEVVESFGYKLHLLVDVKHEVVLGYTVTEPNAGDGETLPTVLDQVQANLPEKRIETPAYDKAADTVPVHTRLAEDGITALIRTRKLRKCEPERMLPGHDGNSNVVYDEAGTVYCYDRTSLPIVRRKMSYVGHEADRGTLKYRCPAVHEGFSCPSQSICNAGRSYGKQVRVPRDFDLRRFPALPRATCSPRSRSRTSTAKFERLYKGRTAVERVNARSKVYWGADDGNVTGARRFLAWVGVMLVVHVALATLLASTPRREGTLGKLNLSPIAQQIRSEMSKSLRPSPSAGA